MPWQQFSVINSPCNGCKERVLKCHSACDRYKKYKKDIEEVRVKERKAKGTTRRVF